MITLPAASSEHRLCHVIETRLFSVRVRDLLPY
jgi:hypothetical protein